jgi:DNA modification methylase
MNYKIHVGDALEVLKTLPSESVQTCITSPPYFGLRDYGNENQIGAQQTLKEYIQSLVNVFNEVKRVLKPSGTLWLNLGDSYSVGGSGGCSGKSTLLGFTGDHVKLAQLKAKSYTRKTEAGYRPKNLLGVPWKVAFSLQDNGWNLRQDIIWHKPNPMPESVRDRFTKSHEYIFFFSKSQKYFFDYESATEPAGFDDGSKIMRRDFAGKHKEKAFKIMNGVRLKRDVWTVPPAQFKELHFATFPEKLILPCVLCGSSIGETILDPFNGAGTTGIVALKNQRHYIGIELNPEYVRMAENRIRDSIGLFATT